MLRVTIDMHPGGDAQRARTIGVVDIFRLDETANPCDYGVKVITFQSGNAMEISRLHVTAHKYEDGAWNLIRRALETFCLPGGAP